MRLVCLTLPNPAGNLALDEALLEQAAELPTETLRVWESPSPVVVLGRSSPAQTEVNQAACRRHGAPVLRRISGGGTVVALPGCLMYAVVIDTTARPEAASIDAAHRYVLEKLAAAVRRFEPSVQVAGTSDLAVERDGVLVKVSGNSLRVVRNRLLYHGTLLYAADLPLIAELLGAPQRQPEYRGGRPHRRFVTNIHATAPQLVESLAAQWEAAESDDPLPLARVRELCEEKYDRPGWNLAR